MVIPDNVSVTTLTVTVWVFVFSVTFSMNNANIIIIHDDCQNLVTCVHDTYCGSTYYYGSPIALKLPITSAVKFPLLAITLKQYCCDIVLEGVC